MQLGLIGLGKMGGNMARRLRRADIEVIGFNREKIRDLDLNAENMIVLNMFFGLFYCVLVNSYLHSPDS